MELNKICILGLLMVSVTAGQGTDGLFNALVETIKTEVSIQMKIERKTIKEEILREIRDDREKHKGIRKELESIKEGKYIKAPEFKGMSKKLLKLSNLLKLCHTKNFNSFFNLSCVFIFHNTRLFHNLKF